MFILAISSMNSLFREIFTNIDEGVFWLFEKILVNIFNLAGITIFKQDIINEVLNRIYVILGLFILFRLAFSIITYIISPDAISDKDKGFGQIITRVIIALSLLVLTPSIFKYAREAQNYILPVIPRIIVGRDFSSEISTGAIDQNNLEKIAKGISFQTYLIIFNYNEYCNETPKNTIIGSEGATTDTIEVANIQHVQNVVSKPCTSPNTEYRYRYIPFIGTILGCFLVYMMLGISIDIAVRSIKLGLLQLLAPIPIMSYIDPKASKDGAFANWVKNSISTYVDLFARMAIVYLIIFLIQKLFEGKVLENNGIFVWASIIIGLFFFAKKAPQFIKDILGIKGDIGMFKDVISGHGLAGLAGGLIGGSINAKRKGGSALVGGLSGLTASGKQFLSNAREGKSGGILKAANKAGEESQKINTGWRGGLNRRAGENRADAMGFSSDRIKRLEKASEDAKTRFEGSRKKLQDAQLKGDPTEIAEAQELFNKAYDRYKAVSGRYEKVSATRKGMVQDEPYDERVERERRQAKRNENTRYRSALREAREVGQDHVNQYRDNMRNASRDLNNSSSDVRRLENEINYNVDRLSGLQDELPDNSMRHYNENGLFSGNPYREDINDLQTHIQDLNSQRNEASDRMGEATNRRTQAQDNLNTARDISREFVQNVRDEHKAKKDKSNDPDSDIL